MGDDPAPKRAKWDFRNMAFFEQNPGENADGEDDDEDVNNVVHAMQFGTGRRSSMQDAHEEQQQLYRETTHYVHKNERFAISRHVTEFMLNSQHDEPDEALREAFDSIIKRAIRNAESEGSRHVIKLGISVHGRGVFVNQK